MKKYLSNYFGTLAILLVFIVAAAIRFYQINNANNGFYLDEAAIGYNAYSILKTGRDEFGKSFPLLFRSFTDFKAPLYIYFSVVPVYIFGLSVFSTRFISALAGSLLIFIVYILIKKLTNNNRLLSIFTALILAIAPLSVFYSRGAWEANLSFFLMLLATLVFIIGNNSKKFILLLVSGILFVLSAYAYHGQRIVAPLIFGSYILYFRPWKFLSKKFMVIGLLILSLLSFPIIKISLTPGGQSRASALSFFSEQASLPWQNQNNQTRNRTLVVIRKWFALYTAYYSPRNLFSPDPAEKQRWLVDIAAFFPWQLLFSILGLYWLIKKKEYKTLRPIIFPWLAFSPVAASFTGDPFSTVRALPLVFPISVVIGIGIFEMFFFLKSRNQKILFSLGLTVIIILSLFNLMTQFLYILPYKKAKFWEIGYGMLGKELLLYPNQQIVIDNSRGESYIHILFFTKFDPETYQKEAGYLELSDYYNSMIRVENKKFGQFEYRSINWGKEEKEGNIVVGDELIMSREGILNNPRLQLIKEILYPDQTVAFRIIKALKK